MKQSKKQREQNKNIISMANCIVEKINNPWQLQ